MASVNDEAQLEAPPSSSTAATRDDTLSPTVQEKPNPIPPGEAQSRWERFLDVLFWTPPWCRWDPARPPVFSMPMNVLFAFAGTFTVANLYYSHPILNILANDFGVEYVKVAQVPTLAQSGYAVGLYFLCPLGDIFRRRRFTLGLVWFTATVWLGLCLTRSFAVFSAVTFITALTTVTPQIMLPLVGDLAPPNRRAMALSVVTAGNILGILLARLLSGVVTNYTSWRTIYWIAFGLQYLILGLLWLFMPDYPSTNPDGINYFRMLGQVVLMLRKHPVLVQACLVAICTSAPFTNFWTTLTFLLSGAPYHYTPLTIGLFALIGIFGMFVCPIFARTFMDRYVPLVSTAIGELLNLLACVLGTFLGLHTVAGPILQAFLLDLGLQISQIANRSAIYAVEPRARNRVNTAYMVATFLGQITGTSAGNRLYARGGWVASGSLSVGLIGLALVVCAARGPWEEGWVGWGGGWSIRKKDRESADGKTGERAMHLRDEESGGTSTDVAGTDDAGADAGVAGAGRDRKGDEKGGRDRDGRQKPHKIKAATPVTARNEPDDEKATDDAAATHAAAEDDDASPRAEP